MAEQFLPGNPAAFNARALQRLCDRGGRIVIDVPGVYELDRTIFLSSDTELIFGAGTAVKRLPNGDGAENNYAFVNKGALTRSWDYDIIIRGLHLICNGQQRGSSTPVVGLAGELSFFYVKRVRIFDFVCMDLPAQSFCIHICTFEDAVIERVHIEGRKDAVHFGKGSKFVVRHGLFRTFDDPIALNAHDYVGSNPQLGWIRDGIIEDCWDLDDKDTTGYFARILAGSWCDWTEGMIVRRSDTVVSEGRLYRVATEPDGTEYRSATRPTHKGGVQVLDGDIRWAMVQDDDPIYNCGCENIVFRDIRLQKKRRAALSIHFDDDCWSHSYYPGSPAPLQRNLTFENVRVENQVDDLISSHTAVDCVRLINSDIGSSRILLKERPYPELSYPETKILLSGTTFSGGEAELLRCTEKRSAALCIQGSLSLDDAPRKIAGKVRVISSDLSLETIE